VVIAHLVNDAAELPAPSRLQITSDGDPRLPCPFVRSLLSVFKLESSQEWQVIPFRHIRQRPPAEGLSRRATTELPRQRRAASLIGA